MLSACTVDDVSELSDFLKDAKGERSIDEIAAEAERRGYKLGRSTVAKYLGGGHARRVSESMAQAIAAGFRVDVRRVRELAGRQPGELGPWTPTDEAASLTKDQRKALDALILTIVREGGSSAEHEPREKSPTPVAPVSMADIKRRRAREQAEVQQDAADGLHREPGPDGGNGGL